MFICPEVIAVDDLSIFPSVTFYIQKSQWREQPAWKRTDRSLLPPLPSPSPQRTCLVQSRLWPAQASLRGVSTMRTQHCGATCPLSALSCSPLFPLSSSSVPTSLPARSSYATQTPQWGIKNQWSVRVVSFPNVSWQISCLCYQYEIECEGEPSLLLLCD